MRVVIAEDLALLRDGIRRLLEDNGCDVVAAVADGEALIEAVETERPDAAALDVRLPPSFRDEGIRAALEARRRVPGLPVLVLSQYVERVFAKELLADGSGGVGYLLKDRVADPRNSSRPWGASRPAAPRWTPRSSRSWSQGAGPLGWRS